MNNVNNISSSFMIYNKSNEEKTLTDFVIENDNIRLRYNKLYNTNYSINELIESAKLNNTVFPPHVKIYYIFDHNTKHIVEKVYMYGLKDSVSINNNWFWSFENHLR